MRLSPFALSSALGPFLACVVLGSTLVAQDPFVERPQKTLLPGIPPGWLIVRSGDVDSDGDPDLFLAGSRQSIIVRNDGEGRFTESFEVDESNVPDEARFADLNQDGLIDLVRWTVFGVYVNPGTPGPGIGSEILVFPSFGTPRRLRTADVDGDGMVDIVLGGSAIRVLRNNGAFSFDPPVTAFTPPLAGGIVDFDLTDLDGDGDRDLVTLTPIVVSGPRLVLPVLNDGSGGFTAAPVVGTDDLAEVHLGDADQDGDDDVVARTSDDCVVVFRNDAGVLQDAGTTVGLGLDAAAEVVDLSVLGDFGGDGDPDLSVITDRGVLVVPGGAGTTFGPPVRIDPVQVRGARSALSIDTDQDGFDDIVSVIDPFGAVDVFRGGSAPLLTQTGESILTSDGADLLAERIVGHGDFDGDGRTDLVLQTRGSDPTTSVVFRETSGRFARADLGGIGAITEDGFGQPNFTTGDFDGDGMDEAVLVTDSDVRSALVLDFGAGRTPTILPRSFGSSVSEVSSGDFDADGRTDLVVGIAAQDLRVLLGDPTLAFAGEYGSFDQPFVEFGAYAPTDFDGDGDSDLAIEIRLIVPSFSIIENLGDGTFATALSLPVVASERVLVGDLDGDGDDDLLTLAGTLRLNDGAGNFVPGTTVAELAAAFVSPLDRLTRMLLRDLDADGDLDIVGQRPFASLVLWNTDGQSFELRPDSARGFPTGGLLGSVELIDLDGDGDPDVITDQDQGTRVTQNRLRDSFAPYRARIGHEFRVEVASSAGVATAPTLAFPMVGFAQLPQPLTSVLPGFDLADPIVLPSVVLPFPAGEGAWTIAIDPVPSLVGLGFVHQTVFLRLMLDGTFDFAVTAVLEETIGG